MVARRPLRADRRGATVLEHALILPVFFLVVLVLLETGWQVAVAVAVDHGTRRAARWVSLGLAAPDGLTRTQYFARIVSSASGVRLDPARLTVTPTAFATYAQLGVAGAGTGGLGGPDQVVRYVVRYQSRALTPFTQRLMPAGWINYRSVVIAQNEPYPV